MSCGGGRSQLGGGGGGRFFDIANGCVVLLFSIVVGEEINEAELDARG